jgi:hypothetical protein
MNKKIIIIVAILAVVVVAVVLVRGSSDRPAVAPNVDVDPEDSGLEVLSATGESVMVEKATEENTTPDAIESSLEGIDLGDIEAEFETIDDDLDSIQP